MKRLVLILALLVLAFPAVARADYFHTDTIKAAKLEERINSFRVSHGRWLLYPAFNLNAAAYALNRANYQEGKYTPYINGAPPSVWMDGYLTPTQELYNAILRRVRCDDQPLTPMMVLERWKRKRVFRFILLNPLSASVGIHVAEFKRAKGIYQGRGRCLLYTAIISS